MPQHPLPDPTVPSLHGEFMTPSNNLADVCQGKYEYLLAGVRGQVYRWMALVDSKHLSEWLSTGQVVVGFAYMKLVLN